MARFYEEPSAPWYKPRYWQKRTWALVVSTIVVVLVIIIVVPVVVTKNKQNNSYPDYTKLNYTLTDTCK